MMEGEIYSMKINHSIINDIKAIYNINKSYLQNYNNDKCTFKKKTKRTFKLRLFLNQYGK